MPRMLRMNRVKKRGRLYHLELSKQIIKDTRYKLKGSTHRKGTTAISWVIFSVTANKTVEAAAGRASQKKRIEKEGGIYEPISGCFSSLPCKTGGFE